MEYVNQIFIPIDAEDRVDEEHQVRAGSVADPNQNIFGFGDKILPNSDPYLTYCSPQRCL